MRNAKGDIVRQAIENLNAPLGPGDPREIAWVHARQAAFAKYLRKAWDRGADLDHIYAVGLYDLNEKSREAVRRRRSRAS